MAFTRMVSYPRRGGLKTILTFVIFATDVVEQWTPRGVQSVHDQPVLGEGGSQRPIEE